MVFLRVLGIWFVLLALVAFAVDGTKSLAANELIITSFYKQWGNLHLKSLKGAQSAVENTLHPLFWDPLIVFVLSFPSFVVLGVFGFLLYWLARKRQRSRAIIN